MTIDDLVRETRVKEWFDQYGWLNNELPQECIDDCSASGDCTDAVQYWVKRLEFAAPRRQAIDYLVETGAWPRMSDEYDKGLVDMTDEELDEKVLWLACCDFKECGDWTGLTI